MKRHAISLSLLTGLSLILTTYAVEPDASPTALATGNNAFAVNLYRKLALAQEGNLFLSPYSISTALAMTYAGARNTTQKEMAGVLRFHLDQKTLHPAFQELQTCITRNAKKGEIQLSVANSLWPQRDYAIVPEFTALIQKYYSAEVTPCDFHAAAETARTNINTWVEDKTAQKIKNLIPSGVLNDLTRLVLVNAIYFKGDWNRKFDKERTKPGIFTTSANAEVEASMMHRQADFPYVETSTMQMLELPYHGETLSMVILLPKNKDGLPILEKELDAELLSTQIASLSKREVNLTLPRFTATRSFSLNAVLSELGIKEAFNQKADFTGINTARELYISDVIHKAFVEVNEEGTEAAAATAVVMKAMSAAPDAIPQFTVDHPFLFLIREKETGSILFLGRITDPTAK